MKTNPTFKYVDFSRLVTLLQTPRGNPSTWLGIMRNWFNNWTNLKPLEDTHGNFFLQVGKSEPTTMFTAHYDTVDSPKTPTGHTKGLVYYRKEKIITLSPEAKKRHKCLGADDGAGCEALVAMAEAGVPGLYCWFSNEERGATGSRGFLKDHKDGILTTIKRVVSFDRKGTNSVITSQGWGIEGCCSPEFSRALGLQLEGYIPDNSGIFTDSAVFMETHSECTNLSVGYHNEHSGEETLEVGVLDHLVGRCIRNVQWDKLPALRDPSVTTLPMEQEEDIYDLVIAYPDVAHQLIIDYGLEAELLDRIDEDTQWGGHDRYDEYLGNF